MRAELLGTKASGGVSGRRRKGRVLRGAVCDPLEDRRLFSAITWTNRGASSGANNDNFISVFGANAATARSVVDAAITSWARLINNFNFPGGGNTYSIVIKMATGGVSLGANAGPTHYTSDGKPDQGAMTIGRGADTTGDNIGDGGGYFLDPTPYDSSEFQSYTTNAFAAYADPTSPAFNKGDLYELTLHELGHAVGFSSSSSSTAFSSHTVKTSTGDTVDPSLGGVAGPIGFYYRWNGSVRTLLTSFDSGGQGGGGPVDSGSASHYAPPGSSVNFGGFTYYGADDLMTPYYYSGQRRLVSQNDITMLADAYGYTVTPAGYYGSHYDTLDNSGILRIKLPNSGNDTVTFTPSGANMYVSLGIGAGTTGADPSAITSVFVTSAISAVQIDTGGGNDTITLNSAGGLQFTIYGGSGSDKLVMTGASGTTTVTPGGISSTAGNVVTATGLESIEIDGSGGADTFNVSGAPVLGRLYLYGFGGNDSANIGSGELYNMTSVTFDGGSGTDSITFSNSATAHAWSYGIFQGANVNCTDLTLSYTSYNDVPNVENIAINSGNQDDGFEIFYSNAGSFITLHGAGGNDGLSVADGLDGLSLSDVLGTVNFFADSGSNTLYLDDTAAAGARTYSINSSTIRNNTSGPINFDANSTAIQLYGTGYAGTYNFTASIFGPQFYIYAGASNDQFNFTAGAAFNVNIDGGGGFNAVLVDDRAAASQPFNYEVGSTGISRDFGLFGLSYRYTIGYTNVGALTAYYANNGPTTLITGVPVTAVGQQFTLFGGTGNETFTVVPHDVDGNLTINGLIGIVGGAGTESFTIDDSASSVGIAYSFSNPFGSGTQDIYGMGSGGIGVASDVPALTIKGSAGDDTFDISAFKTGQSLTIRGNGGSDTVNWTPISGNLSSNITNIASFTFDGGDGFDYMNVSNTAATVPWSYYRDPGYLYSAKAGYALVLYDPNVEYCGVSGGSGGDTYTVPTLASSVYFAVFAGAGVDHINVGANGLTGEVSGVLQVFGDGNDTVTLDDSADTTGRTIHTGAYTVGQVVGDDLLGSGGLLYAPSAVNVVINLGSGPDTVYAQPAIYGHITINAGDPTDAPGDTLVLALAAYPDAVVTATSATDGFVTVGDGTGANQVERLAYTGFETGPTVDNLLPGITGIVLVPAADGSQDLVVAYNTVLIADPGIYAVYFLNTSTGGAQYADSETYDPVTLTSTFHFLSGDLSAGVYRATFSAGYLINPSGNAAAADVTYDFIWVPTGVTLQLPPTGDGTQAFVTQQIAIDPDGVLDVTDNAIIVRGGDLDFLSSLVAMGLNISGAHLWTGTGITSSLAAAEDNPLHAVGIVSNTLDGSTLYDTFHGVSVGGSDVLIAYTVFGDADLSGTVDDTDFFLTNNGFGLQSSGWINGDFDFSGTVDDTDFFLLNSGYSLQ